MPLRTLCVLLLAWGCGDPEMPDAGAPEDGGFDAGAPIPTCEPTRDAGEPSGGITNGCAQAVLGSGFALTMPEARPVTSIGAYLRTEAPEVCRPGTLLGGASLVTRLDRRVGEGATARATYSVIGAGGPDPSVDAGAGWSGARVYRGSASIDLDATMAQEATAPVLVDLATVGLDGAPEVAAVLEGVELETDVPQAPGYPMEHEPREGYAVRGVGASVAIDRRDGAELRLAVRARLALGPGGEPDMDRAARVARTQVVVHFAVVGLPAGATVETVTSSGPCPPAAGEVPVAIDGPPGARAAPAFTSFDLTVDGDAGTLLRGWSLLVDSFAHDAATGQATFEVIGHLEAPGGAELPQSLDAEVALLTWDGPEDAAALRYGDAVGAGVVSTRLPIEP